MVTHCINVNKDFTWQVLVHKTDVVQEKCSVLMKFPKNLSLESCEQLIDTIERSSVCCGNPDSHFVEMMEQKTKTNTASRIDDYAAVFVDGTVFNKTVRHTSCQMICDSRKCSGCVSYRDNLRSMYSQSKKRSKVDPNNVVSHINDRYLTSPQKKTKISALKQVALSQERKLTVLQRRVSELTENCSR